MARFNKLYYYTSKSEKKINCYTLAVPKQIVEQANLQNVEVQLKVIDGKIIIEQKIDK